MMKNLNLKTLFLALTCCLATHQGQTAQTLPTPQQSTNGFNTPPADSTSTNGFNTPPADSTSTNGFNTPPADSTSNIPQNDASFKDPRNNNSNPTLTNPNQKTSETPLLDAANTQKLQQLNTQANTPVKTGKIDCGNGISMQYANIDINEEQAKQICPNTTGNITNTKSDGTTQTYPALDLSKKVTVQCYMTNGNGFIKKDTTLGDLQKGIDGVCKNEIPSGYTYDADLTKTKNSAILDQLNGTAAN